LNNIKVLVFITALVLGLAAYIVTYIRTLYFAQNSRTLKTLKMQFISWTTELDEPALIEQAHLCKWNITLYTHFKYNASFSWLSETS